MDNTYNYETGLLWKDENFDVASYRGTAVEPPDVITIPGTAIDTVSFDGNATTEAIHVCKELNHDYKEGSVIAFHVHWYPTTTTSGNVKWNLEYFMANQAVQDTVISGTMSVVQASRRVAWRLHTANFPDLNLGVLDHIGTQIHFRFFRNPLDGSDNYGDDAAVATMGYHYQTDMRGSIQATSKV